MRKKNNLNERVLSCADYLIRKIFHTGEKPEQDFIDYIKIFGNSNPVQLEIGCGKGSFINETAKNNKNINFIAVEKSENVIISAMERTAYEGVSNIRYIIGRAEYLDLVLPPCSIEQIHLYFSCPFPKSRYAKHRLTHEGFMKIYRKLLSQGGKINFKTDNSEFFEFSLKSFSENGFRLQNVTHDLHGSNCLSGYRDSYKSIPKGDIITEYEKNFIEKGLKIYYLEAFLK
ncbi:MAG: tRNA (guanosine(46)-N7)-methyltransferase TrmB [Oscillospiraceae bacterium]|nr:tRNA (guanosine(46)-N7)-methyltransferase TrmB [Oscillospiraceae bacterium]